MKKVILITLVVLSTLLYAKIHDGCDAKEGAYYRGKDNKHIICFVTDVNDLYVYYKYYQSKFWEEPFEVTHEHFHSRWERIDAK